MDNQEILDGNKLISEFMEIDFSKEMYSYRVGVTEPLRVEHLAYHKEWGWLMPVVEKIESLEYSIFFNITGNEANVIIHNEDISNSLLYEYNDSSKTKIEAVWLAVVEFTKWYNKHKK